MNKNIAVSLVFSLGIHLSTFTLARHDGLYTDPRQLMARAMEVQRQKGMDLLFVDTVKQELKGGSPRRTNVISNNDNVAQDLTKGNQGKRGISPNAGKPSSVKQLGDLSPGIGKQMSKPNPEVLDDLKVAPQKATKIISKPVTPVKKAHSQPDNKTTARKSISFMDKIKQMQSDVVLPEDVAKKIDKIVREKAKEEDFVAKRKEIEKTWEELMKKEREEKKHSKVSRSPRSQLRQKGKIAMLPGDIKKMSTDSDDDVARFGEITFNANQYEIGEYFKNLKEKIEDYWLPYLAFTYSGGSMFGNKTVILFRVYPSGKVKNIKVLEHKGDEVLKDFCLAAIANNAPFEPLPQGFIDVTGYEYLPIVFTFVY